MPHPSDAMITAEIWASVMHPDKEHTIENFISRHFVCFNSWQCLDKDKGGNCLLWCVRRGERSGVEGEI